MKSYALASLIALWNFSAWAVECPAPDGTSPNALAAQPADVRLAFLSKVISEQSANTRTWKLLWGTGYALITMGQVVLMSLTPEADRPDWVIGAAASSVGFATTIIGGLEVTEAGPGFVERARVATPEQTCAVIADGERMLREGAATQAFSAGWVSHVANVLFNAGVGLILGLGYGHWRTAGINFGVGTVIGGATALTRPTGLVRGWEQYRAGASTAPKVTFQLVPSGLGAGVLLTF